MINKIFVAIKMFNTFMHFHEYQLCPRFLRTHFSVNTNRITSLLSTNWNQLASQLNISDRYTCIYELFSINDSYIKIRIHESYPQKLEFKKTTESYITDTLVDTLSFNHRRLCTSQYEKRISLVFI